MTEQDVFNTLMHVYPPAPGKRNATNDSHLAMIQDLADYLVNAGNPEGFFNYIGETV